MASFQPAAENNWQCSICLELITDPKQLSCAHTFCKSCLRNMLTISCQREANNSVKCLICGSQTDVRGGNVENISTNVPLVFESFFLDDTVKQVCEICQVNSSIAVHFCHECSKKMCDNCLTNHNNWQPNLKHKIELLNNGKFVPKERVYCQEHEWNGQEYICTDVCVTCKKFICLRCLFIHKDHTILEPRKYYDKIKNEFESRQVNGEKKVATVNSHMTFLESQMDRVTGYMDLRQAEIDKAYASLVRKLKEEKTRLDKKLKSERENSIERLKRMKSHHERVVASIESANVLANHSLKARPMGDDIIKIHDSLSVELKNVVYMIRDDPDRQLATDVADWAEKLRFKAGGKVDQFSIGDLVFMRGNHISVKLQGQMNSMASTLNGKMAVAYGGGGIDIFSAHGQVQQTVLTNVKIREAKFLSDGRYVVLDLSNNITIYTPKCVKSDEKFATLGESEGGVGSLAVSSTDRIYVGYRKPKKIQEFDSTGGNAKREIQCNDFEPWQIAIHSDLLIIKDTTMIRTIDLNGKAKHSQKKPNASPYATACKDNSTLIAWVKHEEGLVSVKQYKDKTKTLISNQQIEKSERDWYCVQEFKSGQIALCTPDRLYIFWP